MVAKTKKATLLLLASSVIANVIKGRIHLFLLSFERTYKSGYSKVNGTLKGWDTCVRQNIASKAEEHLAHSGLIIRGNPNIRTKSAKLVTIARM
jgi:hypothetical protein